jgi:hypothetical protein
MKARLFRTLSAGLLIVACIFAMSGCASVPLASKEQDAAMKAFTPLAGEKAGLYVFRNSFVGQALTKKVSLDGTVIGTTANKTYIYKEIAPGPHTLATQSEFSDNTVTFDAEGGKNYFARQYIKVGVFVGGAGVEMVDEEEGKREVIKCNLLQ